MGLEPTTSEATTRCYHQLSYTHHNQNFTEKLYTLSEEFWQEENQDFNSLPQCLHIVALALISSAQ